MPNCGSQVIICDLPIRFDTYKGCSHACKYCFVNRKTDISNVSVQEGPEALLNFIQGKRTQATAWCDWNIPLHWGGLSDPFQPCEKLHKNSLACLEILAKTKYPFVVSTKGTLPMEEPYYSLFKECNCVFQVSMTCPSITSRLELGAPSFEERLTLVQHMAKAVQRVIVRCQPYLPELHTEIKEQIARIAQAGAHGIIYEALKLTKRRAGMIKLGADFVYPYLVLRNKFMDLKDTCHANGLKFYSGENRLRSTGDSLCCCGVDGLNGFRPSTHNLNHFIYDKAGVTITPAMRKPGTAICFRAMGQDSKTYHYLRTQTFNAVMETFQKDKGVVSAYVSKE